MKNIVLIGFMGSGKTEIGKRLADRLGFNFIDTDSMIVRKTGRSISDIFREEGEEKFRDIEAKVIRDISDQKDCVIATGGGIVINRDNLSNLERNGWLVWLKASPETIFDRVRSESHRPLLSVEDPLDEIKRILNIREKLYAEANISVDTDQRGIDEITDIIVNSYKKMADSSN